MKKLIYTALLVISASLIMTSCTEENVAPKTGVDGGMTSNDKSGN